MPTLNKQAENKASMLKVRGIRFSAKDCHRKTHQQIGHYGKT